MNGHLMTGTIRLAEGESFNDKIDQSDWVPSIDERTTSSQSGSSEALWDLQINHRYGCINGEYGEWLSGLTCVI